MHFTVSSLSSGRLASRSIYICIKVASHNGGASAIIPTNRWRFAELIEPATLIVSSVLIRDNTIISRQ